MSTVPVTVPVVGDAGPDVVGLELQAVLRTEIDSRDDRTTRRK
jgi:hypothetical protein